MVVMVVATLFVSRRIGSILRWKNLKKKIMERLTKNQCHKSVIEFERSIEFFAHPPRGEMEEEKRETMEEKIEAVVGEAGEEENVEGEGDKKEEEEEEKAQKEDEEKARKEEEEKAQKEEEERLKKEEEEKAKKEEREKKEEEERLKKEEEERVKKEEEEKAKKEEEERLKKEEEEKAKKEEEEKAKKEEEERLEKEEEKAKKKEEEERLKKEEEERVKKEEEEKAKKEEEERLKKEEEEKARKEEEEKAKKEEEERLEKEEEKAKKEEEEKAKKEEEEGLKKEEEKAKKEEQEQEKSKQKEEEKEEEKGEEKEEEPKEKEKENENENEKENEKEKQQQQQQENRSTATLLTTTNLPIPYFSTTFPLNLGAPSPSHIVVDSTGLFFFSSPPPPAPPPRSSPSSLSFSSSVSSPRYGGAICCLLTSDILSIQRDQNNWIVHAFSPSSPPSSPTTPPPSRTYNKAEITFANQEEEENCYNIISQWEPLDKWQNDEKKKLLILINPMSGERKGDEVWESVAPIFSLLPHLNVVVQRTERAGHGEDIAKSLDSKEYSGVIMLSGDGLFHEYLNGAAAREDFTDFVKQVTIGIIPGGSGNGLAATLATPDPITAAFCICKGGKQQMDVAQTWQGDQTRWIFLTVTWGIIADLDVGSEGWRWMGPTMRYLASPVYRLAKRRRYPGRLWMLPYEEDEEEQKGKEKEGLEDEERVKIWPEQGKIDPALPKISGSGSGSSSGSGSGDIHSYLPDEHEREIDGKKWRVFEGTFTMVTASLVHSIAVGSKAAPHAKLDDGAIDIVYTTDDASKVDLAGYLLSLDSEEVDLSCVRYRKAKAFMLESCSDKGRFALDGELTSYEPIRCEVMPRLVTVFSPYS